MQEYNTLSALEFLKHYSSKVTDLCDDLTGEFQTIKQYHEYILELDKILKGSTMSFKLNFMIAIADSFVIRDIIEFVEYKDEDRIHLTYLLIRTAQEILDDRIYIDHKLFYRNNDTYGFDKLPGELYAGYFIEAIKKECETNTTLDTLYKRVLMEIKLTK